MIKFPVILSPLRQTKSSPHTNHFHLKATKPHHFQTGKNAISPRENPPNIS